MNYVQKMHGVRFFILSFLEQLDPQLFQLKLLYLATCRFGVSFHIKYMRWCFTSQSAQYSPQIEESLSYRDDGSTVP